MIIKHVFNDLGELRRFDEEGIYEVEVSAAAHSLSPRGDDKITLILKDSEDRQVNDDLYFTEKAAWRIDLVMKALKLSEGMEKGHSCEITPELFVGRKGKVDLRFRTYQDKEGKDKQIMEVKRWLLPEPKVEEKKKDGLPY